MEKNVGSRRGVHYIGVGVGAMIFDMHHRLLMGLRGPKAANERGHWEIPGGAVELGEPRAMTVVRETYEEIGARVRVVQELLTVDHFIPAIPATATEPGYPAEHWLTTPFLVELLPGETPRIMEPGKCTHLDWFPLDALPNPLAITTELNLQSYRHYLKLSGKE